MRMDMLLAGLRPIGILALSAGGEDFMTRYFTQYWSNETWDRNLQNGHQDSFLDHTADNHFRKRGVGPGDHIYIVTIRNGGLYLLCRGVVDRVTSQRGAATALGTSPELLWEADDHLLFLKRDEAAREDYQRKVPLSVVRKLDILRVGGPKPLSFKANGQLDQQALRGVCELAPKAAASLDQVLGIRAEVAERRVVSANAIAESAVDQYRFDLGLAQRRASKSATATEHEFERTVIEPLLARWPVVVKSQFELRYRRGSVISSMIIDHLVSDSEGQLTLFENKRQLGNPSKREEAVEQARSYALELKLPSFIVAAPQGLWLYRLWQGQQHLHKRYAVANLSQHQASILQVLRDVRTVFSKPPEEIGPKPNTERSRTKGSRFVLDPPPPGLEIYQPPATAILDAMVQHAVDSVGPLDHDTLRRLVRDAWGYSRAGARVRHAIDGSVTRLKRHKLIELEPDGLLRSRC